MLPQKCNPVEVRVGEIGEGVGEADKLLVLPFPQAAVLIVPQNTWQTRLLRHGPLSLELQVSFGAPRTIVYTTV